LTIDNPMAAPETEPATSNLGTNQAGVDMRGQREGCHQRPLLLLAALVLVALTTGCSGLRLHSPERDKQGDLAKEAWAKVDVKGQMTAARELQAGILSRQQAALAATAANNRELLILQIAYGGSIKDTFGNALKASMRTLTGGDTHGSPQVVAFKTWLTSLKKEDHWTEEYARIAFDLTRFGLELPNCTTWDANGAKAREPFDKWLQSRAAEDPSRRVVEALLGGAQRKCTESDRTASAAPRAALAGELGTLARAVDAAKADLAKHEEHGKEARNRFGSAKSAYDIAEAKLKAGTASADAVKKAAAELETAAKAIVGLDGLFNEKFLSDARRDELGRLAEGLGALQAGEELPADASKVLVALKVFPELIDGTRQSLLEAKRPLLVPLLIRRDQEKIKAEAIERDVAALKLRLELLSQRMAVAAKRADLLAPPLEYYDAHLSETQRQMALSALHSNLASQDKTGDKVLVLYRALSRLLYSEGALLGRQLELEFQASAIEFERSVGYAEGAVLQWHALIDASVAQLDAYAKSGIKSEALTSLVNALGVLYIGHGVNK
jgi:hypothetical protein